MNTTSSHNEAGPDKLGPKPWLRLGRAFALLIMVIFAAGTFTGFIDAHGSAGGGPYSAKAITLLSVLGLLAVGSLVQLIRDLLAIMANVRHLPGRERASVQFLALSVMLGLIVGITIAVWNFNWGGSGTLSPTLSIVVSLLFLTVGSWISWRWWRAIDEHEQAAYVLGANISAHFILGAGVVWWILSLSDLVPAPSGITLIFIMSFVWTAVWLWRKYK